MITPDTAAASGGLTASYLFWRWLKEPSWESAICAGAGVAFALLAKLTWIILMAVLPLTFILWARRRSRAAVGLSEIGQLFVIISMAVYLLNLAYRFDGTWMPLRSYAFSSTFLGGPPEDRDGETGNRFRHSIVGLCPIPLPRDYVYGIDLQKLDFEQGGRSYLRGEWKNDGWWYYYLYAAAIKLPLGTWLLSLLAVWISARQQSGDTHWRDDIVVLAPAAVVFVLVSSQTGLNRHFRYVLPCLPFAFIWIGKAAHCIELGGGAARRLAARRPLCGPSAAASGSTRIVSRTLTNWQEAPHGATSI